MSRRRKNEQGFTLVELLVYTALTAIIVGLFGGILVTVTRIQGQQNGSIQITREMNFLTNAITNRVRDAREITTLSGSQLGLLTNTYPADITLIELTSGKVYVTENGKASAALSSDRIVVDTLNFDILRDVNSPSSTSVMISITASYNSSNPQNQLTRSIQTSASPLLLSQ